MLESYDGKDRVQNFDCVVLGNLNAMTIENNNLSLVFWRLGLGLGFDSSLSISVFPWEISSVSK